MKKRRTPTMKLSLNEEIKYVKSIEDSVCSPLEVAILLEMVGLDTRKYTFNYLAEQLGFRPLLLESHGSLLYINEKFDVMNAIRKIRQFTNNAIGGVKKGFDNLVNQGKNFLYLADQTPLAKNLSNAVRQFVANNVDHRDMEKQAVNLLQSHYTNLNRTPDEKKQDKKDGFVLPSTPKNLMLRSRTQDDANYQKGNFGSALLSNDEMNSYLLDLNKDNDPVTGKGIFTINPSTGEKEYQGKPEDVSGVERTKGIARYTGKFKIKSFTNNDGDKKEFKKEEGDNVYYVRNIDKPGSYRIKNAAGETEVGQNTGFFGLFNDMNRLKRTYVHELTHTEDNFNDADRRNYLMNQENMSVEDAIKNTREKGFENYRTSPEEQRARHNERLGKQMKLNVLQNALRKTFNNLTGKKTNFKGNVPESIKKQNTPGNVPSPQPALASQDKD